LALLFGSGLSPATALASPVAPQLVVEAPAALEPEARRLREMDPTRLADAVQLVGLDDPGAPIRVLVVPETAPGASQVPSWVTGFAVSEQNLVVLLPSRLLAFPDSSLEDLLRHEVAHVLVDRAAAGHPLPRWFHEGVAMIAGESWGLEERSRFSLALVRGQEVSLAQLERAFGGGEATVGWAYAVAGAFVRDIVRQHGAEAPGAILDGVAAGLPFEEAFARATGASLRQAEASFWKRQTFWYRWVPLLTSSVALWSAITVLALWAMRRRRKRDATIRARWEAEEDRARAAAERPNALPDRFDVPPEQDRTND
jgi:hypothetical protein